MHYFPYDVKLRLLAHSRSFLANQKARNAIVGDKNLLKDYFYSPKRPFLRAKTHLSDSQCVYTQVCSVCEEMPFVLYVFALKETSDKSSGQVYRSNFIYMLFSFFFSRVTNDFRFFCPGQLVLSLKSSSFRGNVLLSMALSCSSPEAALLLVITKNRDLWPGPTPEVRDSRTSRHSAHVQSQV